MGGKVKDILKVKGHHVFSVSPSTTVYEAIEQMCERNIGGVVVVDQDQLVGIFTERDYARKLILKGKASKGTPISEIMTRNPITVTADTLISDCMNMMSDKRIRHLPIMDGARVTGMISIGDVVKHIIEDQKATIEHLEHYITGT